MTLAMGGREARAPQAHVLLADEDETFLSRIVAGSFGGQSDAGSLARVERVTRAEGQVRMAGGEATALLMIPAGFSKALIDDRPIALELLTNPAQSILPGIVEEVLSVVVDGSFYAQRLIGRSSPATSGTTAKRGRAGPGVHRSARRRGQPPVAAPEGHA